mgnify:FL=1
MGEEGLMITAKESYVVDALSYAEAEAQIIEEMSAYISGEFKVLDIKQPKYNEIFFSESTTADKWYKAKLEFITMDEKTEKEKKQSVFYLVQAGTFIEAVRNIDEVMGKTMIDYVIKSITESPIFDVFEHHAKVQSTEKEDAQEYEE